MASGLRSVVVVLAPSILGTFVPGVDAKWDRFPCPRLKPWLDSVCRRNASKSGFESMGRCLGDAAPKERIEDVGGLQCPFGPAPESRGSVIGSTMRPK